MSAPILFYSHFGPYGWLSNWYTGAPFALDGVVWPTVEHYFMAQKDVRLEVQRAIREAASPKQAKQMGSARGIVQLRPDWDHIKYQVMLTAVRAKFGQNQDLRAKLLATGDRSLHENCPDPWWGGGPNFPNGRDWLGKVLMEVREELSE